MLATATTRIVRPDTAFLRAAWARPVILCGQQSLYIFCLGILLSVLGHFLLVEVSGAIATQIAINLAGIGTMIGVAALLDWFKRASRRPGPRPSSIPAMPSE